MMPFPRDCRAVAYLVCVFALSSLACAVEPADAREQNRRLPAVEAPRKGPHPEWMLRPAEKITLSVRGMEIREFARILSERVGVPIVVMSSAQGNVTIRVEETPWDAALARAIKPLGLRYDIIADSVVIHPQAPRSGVILGDPPPGYYRVGGDVRPPKLLTSVDPVYAADARNARVSGIVIVEALIGDDGRVRDAKILKGLPRGLDQAALDAIRQWTFEPGTLDGKPVGVVFNLTVNFKLDATKQEP